MTTSPGLSSGNVELSAAKSRLLQQRLRRRTGGPAFTIPRLPAEAGPPPLSFAQERLWFMDQFVPGSGAYTIPLTLRLRGPLDTAALTGALDEIVARHETLRTCFPTSIDGEPLLVVHEKAPVRLLRVDVSAEAEPERRAVEILGVETARPFDLTEGPLLRAVLVRLAEAEHILLVALHHIVSDGWSMEILADELCAAYGAIAAGRRPELPELPIRYGDFAAWQRERLSGPAVAADLEYWKEQLLGVGPLELPLDRPRRAEQSFAGASHGFHLDPDLAAALTRLSREHDATLYMTLLAAYQTVLSRHSGQHDFAVGSPVAGRPRTELERMIGLFVNVLAMRADLTGDPDFAELLARTRRGVLDAYAHQELPFEQLVGELNVERDVSRSPIFQVIFTMQSYANGTKDRRAGELVAEPYTFIGGNTRFDLELYVVEQPDGLDGMFIYNRDLFDPETIARLSGHLTAVLRAIVADPGTKVSRLELLGDAELARILDAAAGRDEPYPDRATLPELIEAQVARDPRAIAVEFEDGRLSYGELNARANRLAHRLRDLGVGSESRVAICAERSLDLVIGLLGILKSGGAYVPLDPEYPRDRLAFMLADAAAAVLVTEKALLETLPTADVPIVLLDEPDRSRPARNPERAATEANAAYMIYTSGSTGQPKGVPNTHRGICNRLDWMQKTYPLTSADAVLQKTPASFDVSVWEFFWPLLAGARLVVARPGGHKDTAYLRDLIVERKITTMHFVPSMLAAFLEEDGIEACVSLKRVVCSGEALPAASADRFLSRLPGCELHNLYGPTEAAIDVSHWRCAGGETEIPIGRPVQNTRLHVLDEHLRPVPVGVAGELHIAGPQLARGYHDRPALTAERFVPDPYGPAGSRLYRTGDLTRLRADGAIEFLGRIDHQVKLRGLRIELGEIEVALRARPGVRDTVVVVRDERLVAYLIPETGAVPDPAVLRAALGEVLPDYMVPGVFVTLEAFPLTPNGKLDRAALPEPEVQREAAEVYTEPSTPAEIMIAAIWREVLRVPQVGVDDDFFQLGGHSLMAIQATAKLRRALTENPGIGFGEGRAIGVMDLFTRPTVRGLAMLLERPEGGADGPRALLYELTRPLPPGQRMITYVCVPYGGGNPIVFQPLADALPNGCSLYALAIPGHDPGIPDEAAKPIDEVARLCAEEILARIEGPLVLYGHCGIGGAIAVETARLLEEAGRELEAVYMGAIFPFARPRGRIAGPLARLTRYDRLRGDRAYENRMKSMGADTVGLDAEQIKFMARNMRVDTLHAEEYFTRLLGDRIAPLRAPIISVVGEQDPATDYYRERYREWHFLSEETALVVLDEAGHYFIKYRAAELAEILTNSHVAMAQDSADTLGSRARGPGAGWWLEETSSTANPPPEETARDTGPKPSMQRFLLIASAQLVALIGTALTDFAIPIWIYTTTGSLLDYAVFFMLAIMPGVIAAPLIGALVDRSNRRRVMLAGNGLAGVTQLTLGVLLWTDTLQIWHFYPLTALLSIALTIQRLGFGTALPQLVPKQYLGHANGVMQMVVGTSQFVAPLLAVAMLASIGLKGIIVFDVLGLVFVLGALLVLKFPATMAHQRRESLWAEIVNGFKLSIGDRHFRAIVVYFALLNTMLSAALLSITPLVLSFNSIETAGRISFLGGVGTVLGGLVMALWGGPRKRRMRGVLIATLVLSGFAVVTGLHESAVTVGLGAFGLWGALALVNGIYITIVHVKVPQRFHGRVMALNQMVAWSTLPLGWGIVAPVGQLLLEPMLMPGGALASSVGAVIGVGPGRGLAFLFILLGVGIACYVLICMRLKIYSRFDDEVPDATPDDIVGAEALKARTEGNRITVSWTAPAFAKAITMPLSAEKAATILGRRYPGVRVDKVLLRTGGEISAVYEVVCARPDLRFIVKIYPEVFAARLRKELHVYSLLENAEVNAPAVVLWDESKTDLPHAYIVMTKVEGRPLSEVSGELPESALLPLYTEMGRALRAIHGVTLRDFGPIDGDGVDAQGSNAAYIGGQFDAKLAQFTDLGGDPALHAALERYVADRRHLLDRAGPPVLCHHDFHERNVMVARENGVWRMTGVIDMENAVSGDPLLDIARTDYFAMRGDPDRVRAFNDGYGPLPQDWQERADLYRMYHVLDQWHWLATLGQTDALPLVAEEFSRHVGAAR
ncbi:non-ribosomal peptide synthetase [Rhizohabitans arisaemae]|uniref:non-ribosomal peptide synthetase n=1 Tax=Rhizohabitans arisaemae TaxID=2720610 RepID=UPI0024B0FD57|nr:non-ribosomal peptide synthetase [Rhizohabitans arisaemae]